MSAVDLYGMQSDHTAMRQVCDYNHWYDCVKNSARNMCEAISHAAVFCTPRPASNDGWPRQHNPSV